jgi:hypothetical protein
VTKTFREAANAYADLADEIREEVRSETRQAGRELEQTVENTIRRKDLVGAKRGLVEAPDTFASLVVAVPELYKYVEFGTGGRGTTGTIVRGHTPPYDSPSSLPPYDPIYRWLLTKGITPTSDAIDTQAELAHVIRSTIHQEGTYASPFLRPSWHNEITGWRNVRRQTRDGILTATRTVARG